MRKNNKGIGGIELITIIGLLLVIFAFFSFILLKGLNRQRIDTMKENALTLSKTVVTNIASFRNVSLVYLGEAIDEKVSPNIKSPFGGKYCDPALSKVESDGGRVYVTLKCGKYEIHHIEIKDKDKVPMIEVSEWDAKKPEADEANGVKVEETTLYNCIENGKEKFDSFYEKDYLLYRVNKEYNTNYYFMDDITNCTIKPKKFFRTVKDVEQK